MELQFKAVTATKANKNEREVKDCTGKNIYIGIDVHKKEWKVSIRGEKKEYICISMDPDPDTLHKYLSKNFPGGKYHSVYEAGFSGYWADRRLRELGIRNIVTNPGDIPQRGKEKRGKTDSVDAGKLSRELEGGNLEGVYVPTAEEEAIRSWVRHRNKLAKDEASAKTEIKMFLLSRGVRYDEEGKTAKNWSKAFIRKLAEKEMKTEADKELLELLLEELEGKIEATEKVTKKIEEMINKKESFKRNYENIKSVPGVGKVTAMTIMTELIVPDRFMSIDGLKSYSGLKPMVYSSGDRERVLGLDKAYNHHLQAAWNSMIWDKSLRKRYFDLLGRGMAKANAIIRIAVKILKLIMVMWKNQCRYNPSILEAAQAK
ncbi:MAG: IS110 family transposase [Ignavibacteriaceae bacterium]|nr:IS110 family transposase [Ignavibacteriaceae bacterium]NUM71740.1 IS110 family transposase [Ignavibacteriaceae bacterium]